MPSGKNCKKCSTFFCRVVKKPVSYTHLEKPVYTEEQWQTVARGFNEMGAYARSKGMYFTCLSLIHISLPIIATQAGDLSAYIPTNVISITDGQIFLESDLFFSCQRPAVNVGLSVSRVGGAAQTKAMKKAAGSLRIDLAQFREMEVFTQFSSDLDDETKASLTYGKGLMELLKQPLCHPLSLSDMVVSLVAAIGHKFMDVEPKKIKAFQAGLLEFVNAKYPELVATIEKDQVLTDELREEILAATDEYKKVNHG